MNPRHFLLATTVALLAGTAAVPVLAAPYIGCPTTSGGVPVMPWSEDLGTGEDGGVKHAIGTTDPDWVVHPGNGPTYSITPNGAWVVHPNANWINSKPSSSSGGTGGVEVGHTLTVGEPAPPISVTVGATILPKTTRFRTTFTLPNLAFKRSLSLTFAADNGVLFYLNGVPIGGYDPPLPANGIPDASAFTTLRTLAWAGAGFVNGVNNLDAVVTDYGVATGLIVIGSAEACQPGPVLGPICVEVNSTHTELVAYSPAPFDLGTGESGYVPFAPGTVDDQWTTVAPAAGPAYSVATYPGWVGSTSSSWINRTPSNTGALNGSRTYRVTFPLGSGATYRDIDLWYAADNGVLFFLNGVPIGGYDPPVPFNGIPVSAAFNQKHHLVWTGGGFVTGTNVLTAVVSDYGVASGLLVEGGSHACYERRLSDIEAEVEKVIG